MNVDLSQDEIIAGFLHHLEKNENFIDDSVLDDNYLDAEIYPVIPFCLLNCVSDICGIISLILNMENKLEMLLIRDNGYLSYVITQDKLQLEVLKKGVIEVIIKCQNQ